MGLPYVTDRGWALAESGIWLNGYAERIRAGIDETVVALKASTGTSQLEDAAWTDDVFVSQFATTDGYQAALNLATRIKTQAIVSWYPTAPSLFVTPNDMPTTSMSAAEQVDFETSWAAAVMYTPQKLQPGSSFSHFDNQYYEGSSEFMMRPYGTQGVGLDGFMSADTRYGPIGRATLGVLTMMGYATALGPVVASLA
ncbi:hypothetical protein CAUPRSCDRAFT_12331 [Caulochytrium protostelioides]|nr:hypothetical protein CAUPRSCDRAFT_12331 [Caulochytrium protostelioides]